MVPSALKELGPLLDACAYTAIGIAHQNAALLVYRGINEIEQVAVVA